MKVSVAVSNELVFSARLGTDGGAEVAVLTA